MIMKPGSEILTPLSLRVRLLTVLTEHYWQRYNWAHDMAADAFREFDSGNANKKNADLRVLASKQLAEAMDLIYGPLPEQVDTTWISRYVHGTERVKAKPPHTGGAPVTGGVVRQGPRK